MSYRTIEEGATCAACGAVFWRKEGEHWKTLCLGCWKTKQRKAEAEQREPGNVEQLRAELDAVKRENGKLKLRLLTLQLDRQPQPARPGIPADMLGRLIRLCHPDRHGNSEASNQATAWLLAQRKEARA